MKVEYKETNVIGEFKVFAGGIEIGNVSSTINKHRWQGRFEFDWHPEFDLGKLDSGSSTIRASSKIEIEKRIETTIKNLIAELRGLIE